MKLFSDSFQKIHLLALLTGGNICINFFVKKPALNPPIWLNPDLYFAAFYVILMHLFHSQDLNRGPLKLKASVLPMSCYDDLSM